MGFLYFDLEVRQREMEGLFLYNSIFRADCHDVTSSISIRDIIIYGLQY